MTENSQADALRAFVERWLSARGSLRSYLVRRGLKSEDADDVLQDVALRLLRSKDFLGRDMEHFKAMVYTAGRWAAVDRFRLSHLESPMDPSDVAQLADSDTPGMDASLAIKQALEQLTVRERSVLESRLAGQADAEISQALGIPESTVRSLARRARLKVTDIIS